MDIANLARQETKFFPLRNPASNEPFVDEKTGEEVGITMASLQSSVWKNKWKEMPEEVQKRAQNNEMTDDDVAYMLAAATLEVHHMSLGKKKITPDNVVEVYQNPDFSWFRDELMVTVTKGSNFLKKPTND